MIEVGVVERRNCAKTPLLLRTLRRAREPDASQEQQTTREIDGHSSSKVEGEEEVETSSRIHPQVSSKDCRRTQMGSMTRGAAGRRRNSDRHRDVVGRGGEDGKRSRALCVVDDRIQHGGGGAAVITQRRTATARCRGRRTNGRTLTAQIRENSSSSCDDSSEDSSDNSSDDSSDDSCNEHPPARVMARGRIHAARSNARQRAVGRAANTAARRPQRGGGKGSSRCRRNVTVRQNADESLSNNETQPPPKNNGSRLTRPQTSPAEICQPTGSSQTRRRRNDLPKKRPKSGGSTGVGNGSLLAFGDRPRSRCSEESSQNAADGFRWTSTNLKALKAALTAHNPLEGDKYWELVASDIPGKPGVAECKERAIREEENVLEKEAQKQKELARLKTEARLKGFATQPLKGHTRDWRMSHLIHASVFMKSSSDATTRPTDDVLQRFISGPVGHTKAMEECRHSSVATTAAVNNSNDVAASAAANDDPPRSDRLTPRPSECGTVAQADTHDECSGEEVPSKVSLSADVKRHEYSSSRREGKFKESGFVRELRKACSVGAADAADGPPSSGRSTNDVSAISTEVPMRKTDNFVAPGGILRIPRRLSAKSSDGTMPFRRTSLGAASVDAAAATAEAATALSQELNSQESAVVTSPSDGISMLTRPVAQQHQQQEQFSTPLRSSCGGQVDPECHSAWSGVTPGHLEMLQNIHTGLTPVGSAGLPSGDELGRRKEPCSVESDFEQRGERTDDLPTNADLMEGLDAPRSFGQDRFLKQHKKQMHNIMKVKRDNVGKAKVMTQRCRPALHRAREQQPKHFTQRGGGGDALTKALTKAERREGGERQRELRAALRWQAENATDRADREMAKEELREFESGEDEDDDTSGRSRWETSEDEF